MRVAINLLTDHPDHPSGAHWFWTRIIPEMAARLRPDEEIRLLVSPRSRAMHEDYGDGGSGSFSGLSGAATLRGGLLIGVAVLLGVVLLGKGFDSGFLPSASGDPSDQVATGDDEGDEGTGSEGGSTTTTAPATRQPAEVRVRVLNSSATVPRSAGITTDVLSGLGYNVIDVPQKTSLSIDLGIGGVWEKDTNFDVRSSGAVRGKTSCSRRSSPGKRIRTSSSNKDATCARFY